MNPVQIAFGCFWLLMSVIFLSGNSSLMFEGAMVYAATPLLKYVLGAVAISTPWVLAALPFQVGLSFKRSFFGIMRPTGGTVVIVIAYGIFITYNVLNGSNALTTSRVTIVAEKQSHFDDKQRLEKKRKELEREQAGLTNYRPAAAVLALIAAEKQSKRWLTSKECADATSKASRDFCTNVRLLEAEHASAQKGTELQGRMDDIDVKLAGMGAVSAEVDPQAAALAKWSGTTPEDIRAATGAFGPIALEFGALTFLVFAGWCFGWKHNLLRKDIAQPPQEAASADLGPPKLIPHRESMDRSPILSNEALTRSREICEWFFKHKSRPVPSGSLPEDEWFNHYEAVCRASKDTALPLATFRRVASQFVPTILPIDGKVFYKGVMPLMGDELPQ